MAPLLPPSPLPLQVLVPSVTVTQEGAQTSVTSPLPPPAVLNLLLAGLFAVHQQMVLAQAGQSSMVQGASPADLNALLKH